MLQNGKSSYHLQPFVCLSAISLPPSNESPSKLHDHQPGNTTHHHQNPSHGIADIYPYLNRPSKYALTSIRQFLTLSICPPQCFPNSVYSPFQDTTISIFFFFQSTPTLQYHNTGNHLFNISSQCIPNIYSIPPNCQSKHLAPGLYMIDQISILSRQSLVYFGLGFHYLHPISRHQI